MFKYLKLYRTKGIGPVYFKRLLKVYKTIDKVFENLENISKEFNKNIQWAENIQEELDLAEKYNIKYTINIPKNLSKFEEFPPILSYLGDISLLEKKIITIVGTRNPSGIGIKFTENFVNNIKNDFVTCSGFAKGIDSIVHSKSHKTIAFLPGGLINFYPSDNIFLFENIRKNGLLLSDMPPDYTAKNYDFARRNQYLSILGNFNVVIEAGEKSGSLITANFAKKFNKPLFVVPGHPYDINYTGNNKLLKNGANILLSHEDIANLSLVEESLENNINFSQPDNEIRFKIFNLLSYVPISIEEIVLYSNYNLSDVIVVLMELEIIGLVTINNNLVFKNI